MRPGLVKIDNFIAVIPNEIPEKTFSNFLKSKFM